MVARALVRSLAAALLLVPGALALTTPNPAVAQQPQPSGDTTTVQQQALPCPDCDDQFPPVIWDMSPTVVYVEYPSMTINWSDNESLNASSDWITVNGVDRTSSFKYVTEQEPEGASAHSSTSTVPLNLGPNTVQAHICDNAGNCSTESFTITRQVGPLPIVDVRPMNSDNQDMARCGSGCFAATYAQSTVPFFAFDAAQNVTLVYHGDRVDPKPFVHVNVRHGGNATNYPIAVRLQVRKADQSLITFLNGETMLRFKDSTLAWVRLGGQFDAAANGMGGTNVYPITLVVGAEYPDGLMETTLAAKVMVVNENNSAIGHGWTIAGVQRVYSTADGSKLITSGDGSAVYFAWSGSSYISPPGEFSKLVSGGINGLPGWTRLYPDSSRVYFQSPGMSQVVDRFGNYVQWFWTQVNGALTPWKRQVHVQSPNGPPTELNIVFSYGPNGLSSITDPYNRVTAVTVDGSRRLTTITDPDNVATSFGYDASLRLTAITNRAGYTDTLAYHPQSGRLTSIKSPPVPIVGQPGSVALVTMFDAWQRAGVPYTATATAPYTAPPVDSVYGRVINPPGDTVRFTVNKWGQPLRTTDPIGRTTSVTYNAAGLPIQVVRPTGATDQFAYNNNGLVIYSAPAGRTPTNIRYTAWALADSIWGTDQPTTRRFISAGKVDSTRTGGATTRYVYDSRGRVTRVTDSMGHLVAKTSYGATNENRWRDSMPGGRQVWFGYDALGRQTSTGRTGAPTQLVAYDVLNRTTEAYDGVNAVPTRYAYDSLNLRSVTDSKGQVYAFTHDAVGRVSQQTDPLGHSDRYAYDLAGNLRRWWNRRGDSTDYVYDRAGRLVKKFGPRTTTDSMFYATNNREVTALSYGMSPTWRETTYLDAAGRTDSVLTVVNSHTYVRRYRYLSNGMLDSVWSSTPPNTALLNRRYDYNTSRGTLDSMRVGPAWTSLGINGDLFPERVALPGNDTLGKAFNATHEVLTINSLAMNNGLARDTLGRIDTDLTNFWGGGVRGRRYAYDGLGRLVADTFFSTPNGQPC